METERLTAFLGHQRWFAGKGRTWWVESVHTLPWLNDQPPQARIELVTVRYANGEREIYQVPLVYRHEPTEQLAHVFVGEHMSDDGSSLWVYDALHDKHVTGLWTHGIADQRDLGTVRFHREPTAGDFPAGEPSLVIGAEQSNTSVIFGEAIILKVLRKLAPGLNPDIEVHSALAEVGSPHIAPPLGWVEGSWPDPDSGQEVSGSLAMLQEFLKHATEGWQMATTSVRDLLAEGDLHADEVGGDFAGESYRLGIVTAEIHVALTRVLPTGVLDRAGVRRTADGMRERLDATVQEVPRLALHAPALRALFDELADVEHPVPVQRVHGDFHLGQVMRTLDGWKLLDFEGEPAKPLEQRRALDSPLKDVAGMLRSFDYVAHQHIAVGSSEEQRDYRATEWAERNRTAFCDGYAHAAGHDPRDPSDGSAVVLRAFEADKAVYEVMYEARNRPQWLPIPLAGVARLTARQMSPSTSRTP